MKHISPLAAANSMNPGSTRSILLRPQLHRHDPPPALKRSTHAGLLRRHRRASTVSPAVRVTAAPAGTPGRGPGRRHHRHRRHPLGADDLQAELADQAAQDQGRLHQRELRADAHARADAERQVGEAVGRRGAGQEAGGVEPLRVQPALVIAVQDPGQRSTRDAGLRRQFPRGGLYGGGSWPTARARHAGRQPGTGLVDAISLREAGPGATCQDELLQMIPAWPCPVAQSCVTSTAPASSLASKVGNIK